MSRTKLAPGTTRILVSIMVSALVCTAPLGALAKTVKLGEGKAVAEITVPDDWESEIADGSVETLSADTKTYLSADVFDGTEVAEAGNATKDFLAAQKIKVKPETKVQKGTTIAGLPALDMSWDATDQDGPTRFRISLVKVSPQKVVLVTYWRSEAAEKAHGAEVDAILGSIKPIK